MIIKVLKIGNSFFRVTSCPICDTSIGLSFGKNELVKVWVCWRCKSELQISIKDEIKKK